MRVLGRELMGQLDFIPCGRSNLTSANHSVAGGCIPGSILVSVIGIQGRNFERVDIDET